MVPPPIQTELAINTNTMVADIHRNVLMGQGTNTLVSLKLLSVFS